MLPSGYDTGMVYEGGKEARDEMFHFLRVRGSILEGLNCPEEFVVIGSTLIVRILVQGLRSCRM